MTLIEVLFVENWALVEDWRRISESNWSKLNSSLNRIALMNGSVISVHPFGVFLSLDNLWLGLLELPNMKSSGAPLSLSDYPKLGESLCCFIIDVHSIKFEIRVNQV